MKENVMQEKMSVDDAFISLAASVVERTRELIADGWVKGSLTGGFSGVQEFCIHGAMGLALQEMFGETGDTGRVNVCGGIAASARGYGEVEALATAFIVDEAANQYGFKGSWQHGGIAAAPFNDAATTKHQDVLNVLDGASKRLWEVGLDMAGAPPSDAWVPSKWAEVDVQSEDAQQFLYATLA
jgi:hypothetical protein